MQSKRFVKYYASNGFIAVAIIGRQDLPICSYASAAGRPTMSAMDLKTSLSAPYYSWPFSSQITQLVMWLPVRGNPSSFRTDTILILDRSTSANGRNHFAQGTQFNGA